MTKLYSKAKELTQLAKEKKHQQAVARLLDRGNVNHLDASASVMEPKKNSINNVLLSEFLNDIGSAQEFDAGPYIKFLDYLVSIPELEGEAYIKEITSIFIEQDTDKNKLTEILAYLKSVLAHKHHLSELVGNILKTYPLKEAIDCLLQSHVEKEGAFYEVLFQTALNKYNVYLLHELKKINLSLFEKQISNLTEEETVRLKKLLKIPEDKHLWFSSCIQPLTHGFGFLGYQEALLVLAEISNRKSYSFDPVLLKNKEHLDFFITLRQNYPIQKRFIISGVHFCYGEIKIDHDGRAKLWLSDSLGSTKESTQSKYFNDFIFKFAKIFPENKIYLAKEKRQNSPQGCSVFALDDAMHCYTLRLPAGLNDIWDYFSALKDPEEATFINNDTSFSLGVTLCPLPLSLLRTMQSKNLYSKIICERSLMEQELVINKKGETTYASSQKFFQSTLQGERNTRLDYKLGKIIQHTSDFLIECVSNGDLKKTGYKFTFEAFKKSLTQERIKEVRPGY